jgi:hypothetical protein
MGQCMVTSTVRDEPRLSVANDNLGTWARSASRLEIHTRVVADAGLNPRDAILETYDPGTSASEPALQAEAHPAGA